MSEKNIELIISIFRPLLRALNVQNLCGNISIVNVSDYRELIIAGLGHCIIVARSTNFSDDTKGCISFSYDKARKIFLFVISIDRNLFKDDLLDLRIARKAIAVHEFVHVVANLLLLSCLREDEFIKRANVRMSNKIKLTTSTEFTALITALSKIGEKSNIETSLLTDEHFRISNDDGFIGNYGDLYINLLLSYQLLHETILAIRIKNKNSNIQLNELITIAHKELADKKALQREFVLGRIRTFLPNIVADFSR